MSAEPRSRYHAKIHLEWAGLDTELNIFAESLDELYHNMHAVTQITPEAVAAAVAQERHQAAAASVPAPASQPSAPARLPSPAPAADPAAEERAAAPSCLTCGTSEFMELIEFKDRDTGELKRRWKCSQCQKWHWPETPRKGRPVAARGRG